MSLQNDQLYKKYEALFASCAIIEPHRPQVATLAQRLFAQKARYETVSTATGVPWFVIGGLHQMESSGNFKTHLHNGDSLNSRTVHVPKGRPKAGKPPFTWEVSAIDALEDLMKWKDWSVAGTLYQAELYNGWGYQKRGVPSPYLWSFSNHYSKGKYIEDGVYDPDKVSGQCGFATLLHYMVYAKMITFKTHDYTGVKATS